jgi:aquaporin Z
MRILSLVPHNSQPVGSINKLFGQARAANEWQSILHGAACALVEHWSEYLMEAGELALFMISACLFTALLEYPGSPAVRLIPSSFVRSALIGLAMGATAVAINFSPWGKQSGAHMNPAITLTFFRLKKVERWDAIFYVIAQFAGGIAGVAASASFLGMIIRHPAVNYAVTRPGPAGVGVAVIAEILISFLLLLTVLVVSNSRSWNRFTPIFAGTLVATYITFEGPFSGMSMNPARTFGSAFMAWSFDSLWVYFVAPPIGMLLAAEVYLQFRSARSVYCAKFHHANKKRCIFVCNYAELMKGDGSISDNRS